MRRITLILAATVAATAAAGVLAAWLALAGLGAAAALAGG